MKVLEQTNAGKSWQNPSSGRTNKCEFPSPDNRERVNIVHLTL